MNITTVLLDLERTVVSKQFAQTRKLEEAPDIRRSQDDQQHSFSELKGRDKPENWWIAEVLEKKWRSFDDLADSCNFEAPISKPWVNLLRSRLGSSEESWDLGATGSRKFRQESVSSGATIPVNCSRIFSHL